MLEEESVETVALSFVGTHEGTARQFHVVDRVVRRRHRIDQHLLVPGQRHRSRAFGNVERQQIHVGETVGNVAQVGLVTVRTQIPDLGALHEALAVAVPAPLAVETFPQRHFGLVGAIAHAELGRARLFDGRRQHIELRIGPVGGQRDGLAVAEHGVVGVGFAHGEGHAVALDRGGNQLGGERTQRLVDRIVGEELVGGVGRDVVVELHGRVVDRERRPHGRLGQPHAVGLGGELSGRNHERTPLERGVADALLDTVALLGRENLSREGDAGVLDGLAGQLVAAHDISVAVLGLLQRTHADLRSRGLQHREGAAQRSRMFETLIVK